MAAPILWSSTLGPLGSASGTPVRKREPMAIGAAAIVATETSHELGLEACPYCCQRCDWHGCGCALAGTRTGVQGWRHQDRSTLAARHAGRRPGGRRLPEAAER